MTFIHKQSEGEKAYRTSFLDWTEDFKYENGNYENSCRSCSRMFTGNKRRLYCKNCAVPKVISDKTKLEALAHKFYNDAIWNPQKGDYYTSSRADNELYLIIDEDENNFYTIYCHNPEGNRSMWPKNEFLNGFGKRRIHVPNFILFPKRITDL